MAISFRKYVDIVSGVGAGAAVRRRDLIGRIFSINPLIPTKSLIEFDNADDVGTYFGTGSEEYARAAFYFGWISKNITRAKKLAFARWANAATNAQIFGNKTAKLLATFTAITNGSFTLNIGAGQAVLTAINLSGAASLAAVAALIQTAVRTGPGTQFSAATVTYNASRGSFDLVSGSTGVAAISVVAGVVGVDLASKLGWLGTDAILSNGAAAETLTQTLTASSDASNNFGSFLFMPVLSQNDVVEIATWNSTQNVLYMFTFGVLDINAAAYFTALSGFAGVAMTKSEVTGEFPEMVPMIILAATDYSARNSVQNYMFQIFNLTPSVTDTIDSNALDVLRCNYYGQTQTAGQFIEFYQRGVLMGLPTNPVDMNVYANEQWLKDAVGSSVMELLLALAKVSANAKGRVQLLAQIQSVIDEALFNGVISVGKTLDSTQKLFIAEITGDPESWRQVQTIGYWIDCVMEQVVTQDDRTEWKAVYTLVYSKDDVVRKVEGSHVLI